MNHPEMIYSHDASNNCIILKWGESGYYETDYPKGQYNDDIINELNSDRGYTANERKAMEICSMAAQNNPNLNWNEHYNMVLGMLSKEV